MAQSSSESLGKFLCAAPLISANPSPIPAIKRKSKESSRTARNTYVRAAKGRDLLVEHLAAQIWNDIYNPTSCVFFPGDPGYGEEPEYNDGSEEVSAVL